MILGLSGRGRAQYFRRQHALSPQDASYWVLGGSMGCLDVKKSVVVCSGDWNYKLAEMTFPSYAM